MSELPKGLRAVKPGRTRYTLSVYKLSQTEFERIPAGTRFMHVDIAVLYTKETDDEKFLARYHAPFKLGFIDGRPDMLKGKRRVSRITNWESTWRSLLRLS